MANVDFARYKRIVQYFWDPEPKNDDPEKAPIWCLGKKFVPEVANKDSHNLESDNNNINLPQSQAACFEGTKFTISTKEPSRESRDFTESPSTVREDNRGWPPGFLDEFKSKLWFTYRSGFPSIKKSSDHAASSAISLSVRLRSQLVDHGGFTADTGWGCMIRSGQSLLANAISVIRNSGGTALIASREHGT